MDELDEADERRALVLPSPATFKRGSSSSSSGSQSRWAFVTVLVLLLLLFIASAALNVVLLLGSVHHSGDAGQLNSAVRSGATTAVAVPIQTDPVPLPFLTAGLSIAVSTGRVYDYPLPVPSSWDITVTLLNERLLVPLVSFVHGGVWQVLLYSEDRGQHILRVRVTERQSTAASEPPDCLKASSMTSAVLDEWKAQSAWLRRVLKLCATWRKEYVGPDKSTANSSTMPLLALERNATWDVTVTVTQPVGPAVPPPHPHRHALAAYLAEHGGVESETSFGRWVKQLIPANTSERERLLATPTVKVCPRLSGSKHRNEGCYSEQSGYEWQWLPFGFSLRQEWLLDSDRMLACAARSRLHIQGDSLASATSSAMQCVLQTAGLGTGDFDDVRLNTLRPVQGSLGQLLPLQFFTGSIPAHWPLPSFTDYQQLQPDNPVPPFPQPFNVTAVNAGGRTYHVKVWQIAAWPVCYSNSSTWRSGLELMAQYALQDKARPVFVLGTSVFANVSRPGLQRSVRWMTPRRLRLWVSTVRDVMRSHGVQLVDLYTPSVARLDHRPDTVHFCPQVMLELAHIMWREICTYVSP